MIRLRVIVQCALLHLNSYLYLDKKQKYLKKKTSPISRFIFYLFSCRLVKFKVSLHWGFVMHGYRIGKKCVKELQQNLFTPHGVQPSSQIPRNWQQFLRSEENKQELFQFLAQCIVSLHEEKQVITTKGKDILCSPARNNTTNLAPCTHEEADTRMTLHAADAVQEGYRKIVLRTVDTDVLVLAMAFAGILPRSESRALANWATTAPKDEISNNLGSGMSKALPVFHAFTACDTVSRFAGRGKKTAFTVWKHFPAITDTFLQLAVSPTSPISEACMECLERFVIFMYDRAGNKTSVDETRKQCLYRKVEHMMLSHQPGRPC